MTSIRDRRLRASLSLQALYETDKDLHAFDLLGNTESAGERKRSVQVYQRPGELHLRKGPARGSNKGLLRAYSARAIHQFYLGSRSLHMIASVALSLSSLATHVRPVRIHWPMVMQSCASLRPNSTCRHILYSIYGIHSLIFFLIDVQPRIYSFLQISRAPQQPLNPHYLRNVKKPKQKQIISGIVSSVFSR